MAKKSQVAQIFPHHGQWFLWNPSAKVFAVADDIKERERYMGVHFRKMAEDGVHVDFHCWNTHDVKKALVLEAGKPWASQKQHWPTFERAVAAAPATAPAPARAAVAAAPAAPKPPRAPRTPRATAAAPAQPTASLIPAPPAPAKAPKAPKADKSPKAAPAAPAAGAPMGYKVFVADYFVKHEGKGKKLTDAAAAWQKYKKQNGL